MKKKGRMFLAFAFFLAIASPAYGERAENLEEQTRQMERRMEKAWAPDKKTWRSPLTAKTPAYGDHWAAISKRNIQKAFDFKESGDMEAIRNMFKHKLLFYLPNGKTVDVLERFGPFTKFVKIRVHGAVYPVWTYQSSLICDRTGWLEGY